MLEHLICQRRGRLSPEAADTDSVHSALGKAAGRLPQPRGCGQGRECEDGMVGACSWHWQPEQWAGAAEEPRWARCCWCPPRSGRAAAEPAVKIFSLLTVQTLCLGLTGWCCDVTAIFSAAPPTSPRHNIPNSFLKVVIIYTGA